jgi:hypothetical protein
MRDVSSKGCLSILPLNYGFCPRSAGVNRSAKEEHIGETTGQNLVPHPYLTEDESDKESLLYQLRLSGRKKTMIENKVCIRDCMGHETDNHGSSVQAH